MEKYERYKDSGVKWIGEIPEHWGMYKLKYLFKLNKNKNIGNKCNTILSLSYGKIKIKKDLNEGLTPESYESYQLLSTGDIVIRSTDLQNDHTSLRTGLVKIEGAITSAYIGLKNLDMSLCDSRFYHYFLHDWDITKAIYNQGKGLRQSLNWDDIKNMLMPVLDISEQTAIANYLDSVTSKIDEAISQQRKMIDLLNERKQIIIQNAVTKGLDPNAKMKDSGVEWIGEIPEDWEVKKLKHVCQAFGRIGFRGYSTTDLVDEGEGCITLSPSNMRDGQMQYEKCTYLSWEKYEESPEIKIHNGDILFVKTGSTYGKSSLVEDLPLEATINPQLLVFKNFTCNNKFLVYVLQTTTIKTQVEVSVIGGTIPTISQQKILNYVFPYPTVNVQDDIVAFIENNTTPICEAIKVFERQIALLQERKQIIINDVVTGKVKVL
ncbi:MAG: restriction endonuclease subunit S [Prevotella sp.]|nr:restriction endonuclease subunit S [Prevotella sp.]